MAADIANLVVRISGDDKGANESLDRTSAKVEKTGGHFKDALKTALAWTGIQTVINAVGGSFSSYLNIVEGVVSAGMDANRIDAQLAAGIKSTGDASGMTADSLSTLADRLSNTTGISDSTVKSAESMLLTFTNIGKNVFPQATQAVADLATKMANGAVPSAQQMEAASIQLGKALGDPAKGYAQLQRVGVTFTKQQIEQIKTMERSGNMAGAQAVILKEMNKEFGGSAAAAGAANGGMALFTVQLQNAKEKIGQAVIPILVSLMNAIQPITLALSSALPGAIATVQGWLSQFQPVLTAVLNAAQLLGHVFMDGLKPALDDIGKAFSKTTGPGINIKAIVGDIGKAVQGLLPFVHQAGQIFGKLADIFITKLLPAWLQSQGFLTTALLPVLKQLGDFVMTQVVPAVMQLVDFFVAHVVPVMNQVQAIIVQSVVPAFQQIMTAVIQNVWPALKQLIASLENLWNTLAPKLIPIIQFLGNLLKNVVAPIFSHVIAPAVGLVIRIIAGFITTLANLIGKVGDVMGILGRLKDLLWGAISGAWTHLGDVVSGIWSGIQGAIKGGINVVIDILDNMISKINSIHIDIPQVGPVGGGHIGFNIPLIPHLAGGGDILRAGLALVGEDGPEIVAMPAGSHVYSNQESGSIMRVSAASSATHLSTGGTLNGGGAGQAIILEVDGQRLARILLPHQVKAIRNATGVRSI